MLVAHVQVGGSTARAADVRDAAGAAVAAGQEPLHRSKTCWLHLKYAVDDEGTLKLFTTSPGKFLQAAASYIVAAMYSLLHNLDFCVAFWTTITKLISVSGY